MRGDFCIQHLFFFSGHGHTRDNGNKGYLVPVDAPNPNRDEKGFVRKAFAMVDVLALARRIESRHALFLFDSCFSGTVFKQKALPRQKTAITRSMAGKVRQFITAGAAGEEVPARSTFTPAFVDAIAEGKADLYPDGYVTGTELGFYLQSEVPRYVRQSPQFGKIRDYELSRGDFVFVSGTKRGDGAAHTDPPVAEAFALEIAFWNSIKESNDPDEYRIFLKEFPGGAFAELAEARMKKIEVGWAEPRSAVPLPSSTPQPGGTFRDCLKDGSPSPKMVAIPAGEFLMGSKEDEEGRDDDEGPQRRVSVARFALGATEVTFEEYDRFAKATGRRLPDAGGRGRGNRPVSNVSWNDATAYAEWLSGQTGKKYRLPTEAEWEYAARAGTTTRYHWGDGEELACRYANGYDASGKEKYDLDWASLACDDGYPNTAPVGSFSPNGFGLYDMSGNVYEWTCSRYQAPYDGSEQRCVAKGVDSRRVVRGGSWLNEPRFLRSASRDRNFSDEANYFVGFRIARAF
uniref:Formylglycine-generating enzyme, required for sulfatase activity, contains SUMF1/FGE domain n=1 Tax=Candidatus Kentrum sp. DK TaxID=2126562 RepID=A0A450S9J2_9GAMM|nr:MAG: Formylglycine-generating enzyme, required for sulfatase activity, contains SUMF1/FGE domain [Candidatus Kentron sp. DK]